MCEFLIKASSLLLLMWLTKLMYYIYFGIIRNWVKHQFWILDSDEKFPPVYRISLIIVDIKAVLKKSFQVMIFQYEMKMKYNSRKKTAAISLFFDDDSIDLDYYITFFWKILQNILVSSVCQTPNLSMLNMNKNSQNARILLWGTFNKCSLRFVFTEVGNANFILIHLRNKICSSNLKILSQNKLTYHSGIEDKRLNFYRCLPEKK